MKNILQEKPHLDLNGRPLASVKFVADEDLKDKEVLDLGCGFGWFELNALARGVKKIIGTEISEEDLKTAKENIKDKKVEFLIVKAPLLPFSDETFDTVVAWEVIEHLPRDSEEVMFSEVNRVLKPEGTFYLSTPFNSFFSTILDPAWWLIGHRHYSMNQIEKFANENGFRIDKNFIKGGWWIIFSLLNLYFAKWIFRRKPFAADFFGQKENQEYKDESGFVTLFAKFRKNTPKENNQKSFEKNPNR